MVKLLITRKRVTPKIRVVGIVFLFSCFLVFLFFLLFKSDLLTIKHVNCQVKDKTSLADEKRWCEAAERLLLDQRIFLFNLGAVVGELERKFLPIGEVVVTRKLPQTVVVQVVERKPIAKVCQPGGREFLLDDEGVIFSHLTPETQNLKKVILELGSDLAIGQTVSPEIVFLILVEEPKFKSLKYIGQEGIETRTEESLTVLFSRQKDIGKQIRSLQTIGQKYRIEGKALKQVDLRYKQPVVRY